MKKLFLTIALGTFLLCTSNSFSMGVNKEPIPTKIIKEFSNVLSLFFDHELKLDSTLRESCLQFIEEEVGGKQLTKGKDYAYFHMMWTLTDSLGSYKSEDLTNSLDKMIHQDIYKNYFSRMEGESYWIEVIQKEEKYYLVVALN